jgi:presequence protease
LKAKLANMSEEDKNGLISQEKAFKSYQDSMADKSLDCLPSLELNDIPQEGENYALEVEKFSTFSLMRHSCFTNHIVYGELFMEVPTLSQEQLPYLKLLCDLLPHLGAARRSSDENLLYINSHLGDFHCKLHIFEPWGMQESPRVQWSLGGKVMESDMRFFFQLLKDTLKKPHIHDTSRIKVLLSQMVSGVTSSVAGRAMGYAKTLSCAGLNSAAGLRELWFGLSYANFLIEVKTKLEKDPDSVINMLESVWQRLGRSYENNFVFTCDDTSFEKLTPHLAKFEAPLTATKEPFIMPKVMSFPSLTGKIITSPVAFCASSFLLPENLQQISPFIGLGSYIMENLYLHPTIREQGGAYGSGANYYAAGGTFTLNSYRDPHIEKTFDAFDNSFAIFAPGKIKVGDVQQAILGMVQDIDTPLSPGARGITAYTYLMIKKDFELRQKQRHRLLGATREQIIDAMQKVAHEKKSAYAKVAFSNQDKLSSELKALPAHISPVFNLEV